MPRCAPANVIANTRAESPESSCVQSTPAFLRLAASPDASLLAASSRAPSDVRVQLAGHAASEEDDASAVSSVSFDGAALQPMTKAAYVAQARKAFIDANHHARRSRSRR